MRQIRVGLVLVFAFNLASTDSLFGQELPAPRGWRGFSYSPFGGPVYPTRDENGNIVIPPAAQRPHPVIVEVHPCAPADAVGLRAGDRLILVNGQDARSGPGIWRESRPGVVQQLRVSRGDDTFDVSLTEISYYDWDSECQGYSGSSRSAPGRGEATAMPGFKGFSARFSPGGILPPQLDEHGNIIIPSTSGRPYPQIVQVYPCTPAAEVDLRAGDVIVRVNGQDATGSPARMWRASRPGAVQELRIQRGGDTLDVLLTEVSYDDPGLKKCVEDPPPT
ncbi:PDZ domain-containing protein [Candidatus Palauibacter sp.]|uniref:PDZ domain-containing protein n=1 Tax=Candidatus Palauibacter sp. TaxID=3101350 RepID=UPI003B5A0B2F